MLSGDRKTLRAVYFDAWRKFNNNQSLTAMETLIVEVASIHPEYHRILDDEARNLDRDVFSEAGDGNPFFHMGLHLALIEQLKMNRPSGITDVFQVLIAKEGDEHRAAHRAIDCLAAWLAEGPPHDESVYMERLRSIVAS